MIRIHLALRPSPWPLVAGLAVLAIPLPSQAVLDYTIFASGLDVVVVSQGSLQLPQPLPGGITCLSSDGPQGSIASSLSNNGTFCSAAGTSPLYQLTPGLRPSFPFTGLYPASGNGGGPATALVFGTNFGSGFGDTLFAIADSYAPGDPIASINIFPSLTLADLGFTTPCVYNTWTLAPANPTDPYTANDIIRWNVAPVPGPFPLFGAAACFGWSRRLCHRILEGAHPPQL
jgi:hypothetical protein